MNVQKSYYVLTNAGIKMPKMIYGTAWKKERTTELVVSAILKGFRGIDTACQPKHYREDLVGDAIEILEKQHNIPRNDLFIQTKFTSLDGQDPNKIPYDKNASIIDQVNQSLEKSLNNLKTDYIDSLVMHSPMRNLYDTLEVWKVFESFVNDGKVKQIGISNIYSIKMLKSLYENAEIKPAVVQNRFYTESNYDKEIRKFCSIHNIYYQSFWTLTANPRIINSEFVQNLAKEKGKTKEQIFYKFVMQIGIVPLSGTTNEDHMTEDIDVLSMGDLSGEETTELNKYIGEI